MKNLPMRLRSCVLAGLATLAFALTAEGAAAQDKMKLKIAVEGAYAPFNYMTSDGQLKGFDVDIANALCEEMNADCEFVIQEWDGMIPALQAGKFDAIIASMSITEERKQQVDFSEKYYSTPPAMAVPVGSDIAAPTKENLAGKIIGAQASTTHAEYAETLFADSTIQLYPTAEEYQLDLANGRLDAVVDDVIVLDQWLNTDDGECCQLLDTLPAPKEIYGEGIGVAVQKGNDELREKFNAAITAIRANGKYKAINDEYFTIDVFGD